MRKRRVEVIREENRMALRSAMIKEVIAETRRPAK